MRELLFYFFHLPLSPAQVHGTTWDQFDQAFIAREKISEIVMRKEEAGMETRCDQYTFNEKGELIQCAYNLNMPGSFVKYWNRDTTGCPQAVLDSGIITHIYSCDGFGRITTCMRAEDMKSWGWSASGRMASLRLGYDAVEPFTEEWNFFYDVAGRWISQERFPVTAALKTGNEDQDNEDWELTRTRFVYEGDALVRIETMKYAQSPAPVDTMILEIAHPDALTWQGRWLTKGPEAEAAPRWVFYPNGLLKEFWVVDETGGVMTKIGVDYQTR